MEYTKNCPQCGEIMEYTTKGGLTRSIKENNFCRKCRGYERRIEPKEKEKRRNEYYIKNKDKIAKRKKRYRQRPEVIERNKIYNKEYSIKNKEKIKEQRKEKIINNPKLVEKRKEYRKKHEKKPEIIKKRKEHRVEYYSRPEVMQRRKDYNREFSKEQRKNPRIRMEERISNAIRKSLKSKGLSKNRKQWENIVGYTSQDLKEHIESLFDKNMSWQKYLNGEIQIDHIIPISFFVYTSTDDIEFKYCWSLDNLQPLWAKDNLEKHDKITLWGKEVNARYI